MGIVIDEKKARETPCTCIYIGDKKLDLPKRFKKSIRELGIDPEDVICFSPGIIGATSDDQEIRGYCNGGIVKESERLKERLKCLKECLKKC
ncbi:MAG: hypothetical protein DRZ76_02465 [Candidatus Nealsonbacteria bacterium]|nr:MAG: hypothetical protein DRZ76_02465 [Candidatus Nealsonbacteria bacterium]